MNSDGLLTSSDSIRKLRQAELTNYEMHLCEIKNLEEEYENHAQLSTNTSRHTIMDEDQPTSHEIRDGFT